MFPYFSYTNCTDNITPMDNDRQMNKGILDRAAHSDFNWLSTIPTQQVTIILVGKIDAFI